MSKKVYSIFIIFIFLYHSSQTQMSWISAPSSNKQFIENKGQWDANVDFYSSYGASQFWLSKNSLVIANSIMFGTDSLEQSFKDEEVWRIEFDGLQNHKARTKTSTATAFNFLHGNNAIRNVTSYKKVALEEEKSPITLIYLYDKSGNFEYQILDSSCADYRSMRFSISASIKPQIKINGDLALNFKIGNAIMSKPIGIQVINRDTLQIEMKYIQYGDKFGFAVENNAAINDAYPLLIDPSITFASYIQGDGNPSNDNRPEDVIVNSSGNAILIGNTLQIDFPNGVGAYDSVPTLRDGYIIEMSNDGSDILKYTYFGGETGSDNIVSAAIDKNDNIYFLSALNSIDVPITSNAYNTILPTNHSSGVNLIGVHKINSNLNLLSYSSVFGNYKNNLPREIELFGEDSLIFIGSTNDAYYPTTTNAYETVHPFSSGNDAIVTSISFDSIQTTLIYSTYFGSVAADEGRDIEMINDSTFLFAVNSTGALPLTSNIFDSIRDYWEGTIVKMDFNGNLIYSGHYGGMGFDKITDINVNSVGQVIIGGYGSVFDFPHSTSSQDTMYNAQYRVYAAVFNSTLDSLLYSRFMMGEPHCEEPHFTLDENDNIIVFASNSKLSSSAPAPLPFDYYYIYDFELNIFTPNLDNLLTKVKWGGDYEERTYFGDLFYHCGELFTYSVSRSNNTYTTPGAYQTDFIEDDSLNLAYTNSGFVTKFNLNSNIQIHQVETDVSNSCFEICTGELNINHADLSWICVNGEIFETNNLYLDELCNGNYEIIYEFNSLCRGEKTIQIIDSSKIELMLDISNASCMNSDGQVEIEVNNGTPSFNYIWQNSSGFIISNDSLLDNIAAGNYSIIVTDSVGCTDSLTFVILNESIDTLTLVIEDSISCFSNCDGIISSQINGVSGPYTYLWSTGNVDSSIVNLCQGIYELNAVDIFGCILSSNIILMEPDSLEVSFFVLDEICENDCDGSISWQIAGGNQPYTYSIDSVSQPNVGLNNLCDSNYIFEITDAHNCKFYDTIAIEPGQPYFDATFHSEDSICIDIANYQFIPEQQGGQWIGTAIDENGVFTPLEAGLGIHQITYMNSELCGDTASETIFVCGQSYFDEETSNVFSPNGDGINDTYSFTFGYLKEFEVAIYNRWGVRVNHLNKYQSEWDGTDYSGDNVSSGVYFYHLNGVGYDLQIYSESGFIHVYD